MFIGDIVGANIPVTVTQIVGVIALMVAVVATLFEGRLMRFDRAHAFVFAFIVWACLSSLWSLDPESALERVITYLQLAFMVWLLCQYAQSRDDQIGFMTAYLCGAGFVVIQLFIGYALGGTVFSYEIFPGRYTSMGYNPNDLALTLAIGIPMAWYVFTNTGGLANLIAVGYMPAAMAGILLSASRGGTFAALVALLVLPLGFFRMTHGRKLIVALALVAAVGAAVAIVPERSWDRLMTIDDLASEKWSTETWQTSRWSTSAWRSGRKVSRCSASDHSSV